MDYRKFRIAARRYAKKKITREEFCAGWEYAQQCARRGLGAEPAAGRPRRDAGKVTA